LEFTQGEVQDLKEEFKTVKEKFKSIETNHTNISQTNIALSTQIQQIQKEKENCSAKFDDLENYSRRENVICEGVPEHKYEKTLEVAHRIFRTLHMPTPPIQRCHRFGPPANNTNKPRPFIIRLVHYQAKTQMYRNARYLRGTSIIIKDDFCKNTLRKQTALKPILAQAKREDKRTKFVNEKILFHGQLYGIDDLQNMPLDTESATCRKGDGTTVFSGELCPLSNLHPANIYIDGNPFGSSEHYYQTKKCQEHGNSALAAQIRQAVTPREAMNMGKAIKPSKQWTSTVGVQIMTQALKAKFQIPEMKNYLCATAGVIGEGTKHPFWGVGHNLHTPEAMLVANWYGDNLMGKILTELRQDLLSQVARNTSGGNTTMDHSTA
jgi:hypothetical protein